MKHNIHPRKTAQQGITLIEALISLVLLALGVLGLAEVEARMLAETRTTNARATAIWLIADLGDRIRLNAAGARPATAGGTSPYALNFSTTAAQALAAATSAGCTNPSATTGCTAQGLAAYDISVWRQEVADALMNGQARISQVSPQQLQVIVAWQANENTHSTLTGTPGAANRQVADQLQITDDTGASLCADANNPNNLICHVDFIDIPPL